MNIFLLTIIFPWQTEIDLTFAVGANSANKDSIFTLMKNTMKSIIDKYGIKTIHYSVVNYGADPTSNTVIKYSYTNFITYSSTSAFSGAVDSLTPRPGSGGMKVDEAIRKSSQSFQDPKVRQYADKHVVLLVDKDSTESLSSLKSIANSLETNGIRIIPVGFGKEVTNKQLATITTNYYDVIHVDYNIARTPLQEQIMDKVYRGKLRTYKRYRKGKKK